MRCPETNSARSHQWLPMSAKAREAPPSCRVDAPVVVLRAQQPVLQVAAVEQADRAGHAGPHALAGLAHGRVVAVDERDAGDPSRRCRRRRSAPARRRRRARSASRRSRACRRPARPARAGRAGGWACRCARRPRRAPRPAARPCRRRGRPRGPSAARWPRPGVEAATPTRRAPASRADRAWTAPMNPVPAMATRRRRDMWTNVVRLSPSVKQKPRSIDPCFAVHYTCHARDFSRL